MIGQVYAMAVPATWFCHADDRPPKIGYVPDVLDRGLAIHQGDIVCFASRDQVRQCLIPIANVGQQFASGDHACASASEARYVCVLPWRRISRFTIDGARPRPRDVRPVWGQARGLSRQGKENLQVTLRCEPGNRGVLRDPP